MRKIKCISSWNFNRLKPVPTIFIYFISFPARSSVKYLPLRPLAVLSPAGANFALNSIQCPILFPIARSSYIPLFHAALRSHAV